MIPLLTTPPSNNEIRIFLTALYDNFHCYIKKTVRNILMRENTSIHVTESDIEDVIQTVQLNLIKKAEILMPMSPQQQVVYIQNVTRSSSLLFLRNERVKQNKASTPVDNDDDYFYDIPDPKKSPEEKMLLIESNVVLGDALKRLDIRDKNLLMYRYFMGLQIEDISAIIDIKENSVYTLLSRARKRLKKELEKEAQKE